MITVNYVTSSQFKKEEIEFFLDFATLADGTPIKDVFNFRIYENNIHERLEVDIETMVIHEAKEAYSQIRIPCIVEHAGLIFDKYKDIGYPGGLTKPMWNTLGQSFLSETNSANQRVIAKAVIGYCDGRTTRTFIGETEGKLSNFPKGNRDFYWDTVFIPDPENNALTYAQISETHGVAVKLRDYSQSSKALLGFLEFLRRKSKDPFWHI